MLWSTPIKPVTPLLSFVWVPTPLPTRRLLHTNLEMEVGFEPTRDINPTVLQTATFGHSATPSRYQYVKELVL